MKCFLEEKSEKNWKIINFYAILNKLCSYEIIGENMKKQSATAVAPYRNLIEISRENYDSIDRLKGPGYWNAAANRLYYAVFQLLYVGLVGKGLLKPGEIGVHDAVGRLVEEEYGTEISNLFHSLKDLRVRADYKGEKIKGERFATFKSQVDLKYDAIRKKVSA